MKKLLLLVVLLLLPGCGLRSMEEIAIDPELPPDQQEVIMAATEEFFQALPESRIPVYTGEGDKGSIILGTPKGAEDGCKKGALAATRLTPTSAPIIGFCPLKEALTAEELRLVVLHELGHAITGTDDHTEAGNVMAALLADTSEVLTSLDLQFLRARL